MPPIKCNARDVRFQIEDFNNPGTWKEFRTAAGGSGEGGIHTFTKGHAYEAADTTTFGSNGRAETQNMQESKTFNLQGFRLKDPTTGALDPAQELAEAQAGRLGVDSLVGFRFAYLGDPTWTVWPKATFQLGEEGGGNNDKVTWAVTVTRSGAETTAAIS
ncbi:MAG: hypothetical protein HOY75_27245 [Streptomyces sp.]|nr:hypothetical protein [Streptomyces sp.]